MNIKGIHIAKPLIFLICMTSLASCNKKADKPTPAPPVKVSVITVGSSTADQKRIYSATITSSSTTTLSFSVAGTITSLSVSEGQKVTKGQVLGHVEAGDLLNAKNIADAQLAEAQDGYERLKKLHDANALPDVKWVEMQQKLKQAQNAAEMATRALNDATLVSPVNGTVSRKLAETGQTVVPVQPVYEIVSTGALEVDVPVSENEISSFTIGQPAFISFNSPEIPTLEGKVSSKSVVADPLTRSYSVKVALPSKHNGNILPGMLANVTFETVKDLDNNPERGILLPYGSTLLNHDNRWFVWIVKNNKAERRFVEVDELVAEGILVKKGLNHGDTVIVEGMQKVGTGSIVSPISK